MTNREMIRLNLEKLVVEPLLKKGFTGRYPHFRRENNGYIELISFQTNKWGGSFTVEISAVFPNSNNKNYVEYEGQDLSQLTVWDTNKRYRLKGMYDGWFYYRDVYEKRFRRLGKTYFDVNEKQAADFIAPKGYKLVQTFDESVAIKICNEVNKQLAQAFKWLSRYEKRNFTK